VTAIKAYADLHSNAILQEALALMLARQRYPSIVESLRETYAARQRLLCGNLERSMPPSTTIALPEAGLSLCLTLPDGADVSELYYRAVSCQGRCSMLRTPTCERCA
jgi:DNA-binding transcriptional MocR family regulator